MTRVHLSLSEAEELACACLRANGCDEANAGAVATAVLAAERDGAPSHGLFRIPGYVASLRNGKVNGKADPRAEAVSPAVVRIDGDRGFASLAHRRGLPVLAERAREQGLAALALVGIHHFSALWVEAEALARDGLVALTTIASALAVAPAGARSAYFGTNPIAFAWPRGGGRPPLVFDQATSAMAHGDVMIAARDGHALPPGVGLGPDGEPSTDPERVLDGVLLPFGGYKGSALAMMVELLSAGLTGEAFSFEAAQSQVQDGGPRRSGQLILAMDPARFGDGEGWQAHAESFFDGLTALEGVRLPGDRRYANRARTPQDGIEIPASLHETILELTASTSERHRP